MTRVISSEAINKQAEDDAKRKACSIEGYRFIAEQLAALDGKPVTMMDLTIVIAQAKFALQAERDLRLQELRDRVDAVSDPYE